jgi:methyltransferase (TIGR00027 family)
VDFTKDELIPSLRKAGFDAQRPVFFLWLGVVPYLTEQNVFATLSAVAAIPGAEVVFDYSEPLENYSAAQRPYIEAMAQKVSAAGEPWLSYFDPDTLATKLRELGFTEIEDLDRNAVVARVSDKQSQERAVGPHLVRARRAG